MGLFDKKYCDICGEKIGLLGNRKLADANMCKKCAAKLSRWFTGRRKSSLEDIKAQLAYREANQARVDAFKVTRTLGNNDKVLLDEDAGTFVVVDRSNWKETNPDVISFSQVTGCRVDTSESRDEDKRKMPDGKEVSFNPPHYNYSYNFKMTIYVNHDYFDEMTLDLNDRSIRVAHPEVLRHGSAGAALQYNAEYNQTMRLAEEIRASITRMHDEARAAAEEANTPKQAVTCPWCGATTIPDENGRCEYCGGAVNG
ncbi:MAG: DUF4428 domain-containing protein [Eubacterium sp.]|nr:DUF4428 domain-containing protein [Eubacterium sp.]